ncbi:MAG: helix-turn-helix transcriptional regulator [Sphingomonas sp.]
MGLRYFAPAPDLRALISSYYFFHADAPRVIDVMRADIGQMRFMLSGFGVYDFDGVVVETPEICLLGPSMRAMRFDVAGPLAVFGVGLHPAGWAALVQDDASRYRDSATDATGRFGALLHDALDAMRAASGAPTMVKIADVVFRALAARSPSPPLGLTGITDGWLTGAIDPNVDALVAALGVSGRQAERLTKRIYGAPPKLLARKYRSLRAASLIGTSELHWSDAVGDAFFDQSHFIRDFKRFTGLTPTQFRNDPPPITRLTLQRRSVVGGIAQLARVS